MPGLVTCSIALYIYIYYNIEYNYSEGEFLRESNFHCFSKICRLLLIHLLPSYSRVWSLSMRTNLSLMSEKYFFQLMKRR